MRRRTQYVNASGVVLWIILNLENCFTTIPYPQCQISKGFGWRAMLQSLFQTVACEWKTAAIPGEGQAANFVFWCPEDFPADIAVTWDFWPVREPGLCILFFSALGRGGEDIFDSSLAPRAGEYKQYHSSDINALHVSYFRRKALKNALFRFAICARVMVFTWSVRGLIPCLLLSMLDRHTRLR